MTIDVKPLGIISRFNDVDITQTKHFVRLSNLTYINKILEDKTCEPLPHLIAPLPMRDDAECNRNLEQDTPLTEKELLKTEQQFGFSYCQGIGELLYVMVTCRPDISYPLVKLSQYSAKPARSHFTTLKGIYEYLCATKSEGVHYWRQHPHNDLPGAPFLTTYNANNYTPHDHDEISPSHLRKSVDTDFANNTVHQKSVTGVTMKMACGTILYKTSYQNTVALSSTGAEFIAAYNAAKNILYVCSILNDVGLPQKYATTLYKDNQGALLIANAGQAPHGRQIFCAATMGRWQPHCIEIHWDRRQQIWWNDKPIIANTVLPTHGFYYEENTAKIYYSPYIYSMNYTSHPNKRGTKYGRVEYCR